MIPTQIKKNYLLILILFFGTILLSINLNKPFIGHHDWNGAFYSNFARNFVRYGFRETKLGSVQGSDLKSPENFRYFTHYPPLLPILLSLSFKIFGISEASARLVPLLFSLGTISLIYFLSLKFFDLATAISASVFSAVVPIMIYFGKMPVQEVLVLPLVLLSIYFYFNFVKNPNKVNFLKLIATLFLSHLTNWPGYYVSPLFFIHFLIFSKNEKKFWIAIVFPLFSVLMFLIYIAHLFWLTGNPFGGGLIDVFLFRLNLTDRPIDYTTLRFVKQQISFISAYFTKPILLLTVITLIWTLIQIKNRRINKQVQLILMLGIFGITHNVVFRNMAYIHDYMIIYILPFLTLTAGYGFSIFTKSFRIFSPSINVGLVLILALSILLQKRDFTSALLSSEGFLSGVNLGKIINQETVSGDKVLVLSPDFKRYFEVFTDFYADRSIEYQLTSQEELAQKTIPAKYRLIIAIPSRDTPQSTVNFLQDRYQSYTMNEFVVFDTDEKKL